MCMNKYFFEVGLLCYTEENVPEYRASILVKSNVDITKLPEYTIKEYLSDEGVLDKNNCEGIGLIQKISEEELSEKWPDKAMIVLDFDDKNINVSVKVKQVASIATLGTRVQIRDKGTGAILFTGTGPEAANSQYGECFFESTGILLGALVFWIHHAEVGKVKEG